MVLLGTPLGITEPPAPLGEYSAEISTSTIGSEIAGTILANAGFSTMDFFGLFNIFVGLMIVASMLIFGGGAIVWMVRIGTIARTEGIRIMEWGVVILFVLLVLLAIVQFFQRNPWVATFVVSLVVIFFAVWLAVEATKAGKKEEK